MKLTLILTPHEVLESEYAFGIIPLFQDSLELTVNNNKETGKVIENFIDLCFDFDNGLIDRPRSVDRIILKSGKILSSHTEEFEQLFDFPNTPQQILEQISYGEYEIELKESKIKSYS